MHADDISDLPINDILLELMLALSERNEAVLQAPPGAGKTTIVPLALLDQNWLGGRKILVLEPRRIATRAAAARMAQLLGEALGQTVGYRIRLDTCVGENTRIEVITEGILTRQLQRDPGLLQQLGDPRGHQLEVGAQGRVESQRHPRGLERPRALLGL